MKSILLVEDDAEITSLIDLHLHSNLYQLTTVGNGKDAIAKILSESFNLVILDIMLPGASGLEVCKKIRESQLNTPILILTCRSEEADKVLALELGADDYVTKPFGILELLARIKALLRRAGVNMAHERDESEEIMAKDLLINLKKRSASMLGHRMELTPKEFDLLTLLARNPGKSFSREELLKRIWGYSFSGYEHTITAHINRLRMKIEPDLHNPSYILTSWGIGYRFSE